MGFSVDPEFYEADAIQGGHFDEASLYQYIHLRFDEGMTVQDVARRMGVDHRVAEEMERRALRMGRPVL